MWIHESPDWPSFIWDIKFLSLKLANVRYKQGLLLGRMEALGFDLKQETSLNALTGEVIKTSAIEGEILDKEEVRSSIARRLGIEISNSQPTSRNVDGIVEVMLDATQNFNVALTKERLLDWHAALFPTGRSGMQKITVGNWRTLESGQMQVISKSKGRERIHFQAPNADRLEREMQVFLTWFNEQQENLDPLLKAAISHFWFLTIHPFEEGNGRIGRAIADMALARADGLPNRLYRLSSEIEANKKSYYEHLERHQRGGLDVTSWIDWFLTQFNSALINAESVLDQVLIKEKIWKELNQKSINSRQQLVVSRMLENDFRGNISTGKYANIARCSTDTALRDIKDLEEKEVFAKNSSGGRSVSYSLQTTSRKSETKC